MPYNNSHAHSPAADSVAAACCSVQWWLSVCRDRIIIPAAAFAVVHHAPAIQPAQSAGCLQGRCGLRIARLSPVLCAAVADGLQAAQQICTRI